MRWSTVHDTIFCREILMVKPYQYKAGSKESGNTWTVIAENLNSTSEVSFNTSQKSVRDRYRLLLDKHVKKMHKQEMESGSNEEETELDILLESIKEEAAVAQESHKEMTAEKQKNITDEIKKAEDVRLTAMESWKDTKKRRSSSSDDDLSAPRPKRNTGTETMAYLKGRAEQEFELRQQEIELKKVELDMQKKQQELSQSQQRIAQDQMAQQNKMMFSLLEKLINK